MTLWFTVQRKEAGHLPVAGSLPKSQTETIFLSRAGNKFQIRRFRPKNGWFLLVRRHLANVAQKNEEEQLGETASLACSVRTSKRNP